MCLGKSPTIAAPAPVEAPPAPPAQQDAKTPDLAAIRKKPTSGSSSPIAGGTLLTGPSGVANNMVAAGGKSLLGG